MLAPPPGEGDFFYIPQGICPVKDFVISVNNTVLYLSLAFIWFVQSATYEELRKIG